MDSRKVQAMLPGELSRRRFLGAVGVTVGGTLAQGQEPTVSNEVAGVPQLSLSRQIPVLPPYDAVVCGGGASGCAAAIAAARRGAQTLLIEGHGQLGGNGTSGLVSHWLGARTSDCQNWVVGGVFHELSEEAARRGDALIPVPDPAEPYQPHGWYKGQLAAGIPFDPYAVARLLDEKLVAAGVDFLLLTQAIDVVTQGNRITHIVIFNKSGLAAVPARTVVDATGDADIAARGGCEVVKGREEDALMTPASLTFHVDGVDQQALAEYIRENKAPRFRKKIEELRERGQWPFPYDIFISVQLQQTGTMMINTTRLVGVDGTDGRSVSDGMVRGREEIQQLMAIMQQHFPGFAAARLKCVAPALGVRETRRIVGDFIMQVTDVNAGRQYEDTIGFSAYGWDLPDPRYPSRNPAHGRKLPVVPIPYRVMLPRPIENLICPGRAISVERSVLGPLRVMAPCMAMGQAAGTAAALVVEHASEFAAVDIKGLRDALRRDGAIVEWPPAG